MIKFLKGLVIFLLLSSSCYPSFYAEPDLDDCTIDEEDSGLAFTVKVLNPFGLDVSNVNVVQNVRVQWCDGWNVFYEETSTTNAEGIAGFVRFADFSYKEDIVFWTVSLPDYGLRTTLRYSRFVEMHSYTFILDELE